MPDELFDAYFKFSFVRNPWDRAVSWYKNVIEEQCHRAEYGVAPDCTFRDFLTLHGDNYGLQSQLCWLRDRNGSVPLDFIGRFERLQKDFEYVCQQLSMPPTILEPGHARSQNRTPYTAFYDNFTRDLVRRRYAEEIEMFGYTFETA